MGSFSPSTGIKCSRASLCQFRKWHTVLPLGVQVWYSKYMENTTKFALGIWLVGFIALGVAQAIPAPPSPGPACNYTLTCK
jgi:hypothetical protein